VDAIFRGLDTADPWWRIDLGNEVARYRELTAVIAGEAEPARYQEECAWVVAALTAWPDR
jgi:hypothetical protein